MPWAVVPIVAPVPPNFHLCDPAYGTGLSFADCNLAAGELPVGSMPVEYGVDASDRAPYGIPWTTSFGDCDVSVEIAGPASHLVRDFSISPDTIRGMAGWVIDRCVTHLSIGGFVTGSLENMVDYVTGNDTDLVVPYPLRTSFLTVSVSKSEDEYNQPGDDDPAVGEVLCDAVRQKYNSLPEGSTLRERFQDNTNLLEKQTFTMVRGGSTPWWGYAVQAPDDNMTYGCDTNLGAPARVDCAQLEYSQLGAANTNVVVGPGEATFLFSNSCNVAITASVAVVLNWDQIKTALAALVNLCVLHPLIAPRGGRAYHELQPLVSRRSETGKRDRVTGLNALPPHVNITVFQQVEPVPVNSTDELRSCTWEKVISGGDITSCPPVPHHHCVRPIRRVNTATV